MCSLLRGCYCCNCRSLLPPLVGPTHCRYMEDIQRTRDHGQSLYVGLNELCNLCR